LEENRMDKCPKCGSVHHQQGQLFAKGTLWDVRFQADNAHFLSFKRKLIALACLSCGHIELLLKDIPGNQEKA
ncbi:MAG TPA: zinc ribbon domain-containing protein, partial [Gemmataceae bacterium]|nr:zinc ribbon domain-containing protein [Gemmataceae bacterium]